MTSGEITDDQITPTEIVAVLARGGTGDVEKPLLWKLRLLTHEYSACMEAREPTSGLEPLTSSHSQRYEVKESLEY